MAERQFFETGIPELKSEFIKINIVLLGEFDPGSERTLAACLTHASRTRKLFGVSIVAHG